MKQNSTSDFKKKVELIVVQIPRGRVMTYGQIAAICDNPRAARIVGGIAHFGNTELPWHRVVNKKGGLASGFPGGRREQKRLLASEGVIFNEDIVQDISKVIWWPV